LLLLDFVIVVVIGFDLRIEPYRKWH